MRRRLRGAPRRGRSGPAERGCDNSRMGNEPLLRRRAPRSLIAILMFLATGAAGLLGLIALVFGDWALTAAALVAVIALPLSLGAVDHGRWSEGWKGTIERVGVALALLLAVATTGVALANGVSALTARDALGTPARDIVPWFVLAALALAGVGLLLASVPLPVGRRSAWRALGGLLAGIVACLAAAGTVQADDRCDGFVFDRDRWQAAIAVDLGPLGDDEEALAISAALSACGTLDGLPRAEVTELLGAPDSAWDEDPATDVWSVGWVNDGIGPGDGQYLTVRFADDRAVETWLAYDEYGGGD